MKTFILLLLMFAADPLLAQIKSFQLGEEVEYFNNLDWIDSKVLEVGTDGRYLLMLDHNPNKTKWFDASEINSLNQDQHSITEVKVVETQNVVTILYHVGDTVKYQENGTWFETEVLKIEEDKMYQVFTDHSHAAITIKHEKELELIKCIADSAMKNSQTVSTFSFKIGEKVEYYFNEQWQLGEINDISEVVPNQANYLILCADGKKEWVEHTDIRKPIPEGMHNEKKEFYDVGDKIYFYNGSAWIESEVIQIGFDGQIQIYFNAEKTLTKWVDVKEIR